MVKLCTKYVAGAMFVIKRVKVFERIHTAFFFASHDLETVRFVRSKKLELE